MTPKDFLKQYEKALATQDWNEVAPLIHKNATVIFSNGSVHEGKPKIKIAYERNFSIIKSEKYSVENVRWMLTNESTAVYLFDFHWKGLINEVMHEGAGRGTAVLIQEDGKWSLLTEHLGPKPKE